jgi:hypothetical protein
MPNEASVPMFNSDIDLRLWRFQLAKAFRVNIRQRRRQENNIASARPAALTQSPDARSDVRACWRGGSASYRSRASRRMSGRSVDEPSALLSSRTLRIRGVAVV